MWRYEISYRDNGILKNKGFGYKERFDKFLAKLMRHPDRYTEIRTLDNTIPYWEEGHKVIY